MGGGVAQGGVGARVWAPLCALCMAVCWVPRLPPNTRNRPAAGCTHCRTHALPPAPHGPQVKAALEHEQQLVAKLRADMAAASQNASRMVRGGAGGKPRGGAGGMVAA